MAVIGVLPIGRSTFDVPYAEQMLRHALTKLHNSEHKILGSQKILFDEESTKSAITELQNKNLDLVLVIQVTFTDASLTCEIAKSLDSPIAIWAIPEPRLGGRLRLNSFCGLNLAAHALGLRDKSFAWFYQNPEKIKLEPILEDILTQKNLTEPVESSEIEVEESDLTQQIRNSLHGRKIGCIGDHPPGFDTCRFEETLLQEKFNVKVVKHELSELFNQANQVSDQELTVKKQKVSKIVKDLNQVNQDQLDKSLKLSVALEGFYGSYDAFAIRCWPETFTEYGGAICGPMSLSAENKIPCACEADVYGSLSQLLMQYITDQPPFLVDLVDIDTRDNTGVVWHCGQAPISMSDPETQINATIHTNRRMPLLFEFPLKSGPVTLCRISQARNELKLVVCTGEMLKKPMAFTGTSGVLKFSSDGTKVINDIMNLGLEHHMVLGYGDHTESIKLAAAALGIKFYQI